MLDVFPEPALTIYTLYLSRFLWRCALIRLRRLCLAIFAFRLFLREPIQISRVHKSRFNHLTRSIATAFPRRIAGVSNENKISHRRRNRALHRERMWRKMVAVDAVAEKLDEKLGTWKPEISRKVRAVVSDVIEAADADGLDVLRSRAVEQEVLEQLDEPTSR